MRRSMAVVILGGAGVLWVVGLQPSPVSEVRDTALAFDRAVARHDWPSGCDLLARHTRRHLGALTDASCRRLLADRGLTAAGPVYQVSVNGGWAEVRQRNATVFLVREHDTWRVEAASCPRPGAASPAGCRLG